MDYQVVLRKKAQKDLQKLDKRYKQRILVALTKLGKNPYLGKPLRGELKGKLSLHVWPYRIIYVIYKKQLVVYVIDIRHRQGAYRQAT
ncbi:type II toxin-antitoxin system RelE/ParE family toxin [Patescibacteria group bacterium AH-259-L07]|nr:type II toxin-antitoxin system RelE/ParE family toxin [Patescibacteria group bacterium AH-259-L07]